MKPSDGFCHGMDQVYRLDTCRFTLFLFLNCGKFNNKLFLEKEKSSRKQPKQDHLCRYQSSNL